MCIRKRLLKRNGKRETMSAFKLIEKNNITSLRKNTTILVVDDEDDDLYQVLKERQYNVYYKEDMTYSLEAEPFQVVIMDIKGVAKRRKSSMEGFALACEIKKAYPLKKVCCYSGSVHEEITQMLAENSIDSFLMKDADIDKICEKVDKLIEEYANYEKQWDILYLELRHNNISESDIKKIREAYFEGFEKGNVSELNQVIMETLKSGTVVLNITNSILTLLKVFMVA